MRKRSLPGRSSRWNCRWGNQSRRCRKLRSLANTDITGKMLARHDILQRFGKTLRLIEIKSSSVDTLEDGENPFRRGAWRDHLGLAPLPRRRDLPDRAAAAGLS